SCRAGHTLPFEIQSAATPHLVVVPRPPRQSEPGRSGLNLSPKSPPAHRNHQPPTTLVCTVGSPKEGIMNWDSIEGNWKEFKGKAKTQWGKLTDDDLKVIEGHRDLLEGRLQKNYVYAK